MLQWAWGTDKFFSKCFHVLQINPRSGIADFMIVLFVIFWRTSLLSFIVAASTYIPTNSRRPFFPYSCQLSLFLVFLKIAILTGVRRHLTVVWHPSSWWLVTLGTLPCICPHVCVSVCLLWKTICWSPLPIFWMVYLLFHYWIVTVLYIFWVLTLYQNRDLQIFPPVP